VADRQPKKLMINAMKEENLFRKNNEENNITQ
jgi:hypothetical protein